MLRSTTMAMIGVALLGGIVNSGSGARWATPGRPTVGPTARCSTTLATTASTAEPKGRDQSDCRRMPETRNNRRKLDAGSRLGH
jgi:hypothetical protein